MLDLDQLSVNPELAQEGAWVDYLQGSKLKVARFNNKHAEELRFELAVEAADVLQGDDTEAANDKAFEIETKVISRHVLKDWQGITKGGEEVAMTPEVAETYLEDPKFSEFRDDVIRISRNRQNYREEAVKAAAEAVKTKAAS